MPPRLSASPAVVLLLLSLLGLAAAGKLLVVPMDGSHWLSMREVLDILQQKGNEVVVVAPEVNMHIKPSKNFVMKTHSVPLSSLEEMDRDFKAFLYSFFEEGSFLERFLKVYKHMKRLGDLAVSSCEHLLQNKELIRYLEESKFDAVLTDPVVPCGVILAEHLSLPSVYFRGIPCGLDFDATQCPNPPSYVPRGFTDFTDRMSFLQRVKNLLFDTQNLFLCDFFFDPFSKLASEFLQREVTVQDLFCKGSVWLLSLEFVLNYPYP